MQKKCKILQIKIQNSGPFQSFTSLREWGWRCARDGVVSPHAPSLITHQLREICSSLFTLFILARSLVVIDLRSETKRKGSRFESGC